MRLRFLMCVLLAVGCMAALAACGSDDDGGGDGASTAASGDTPAESKPAPIELPPLPSYETVEVPEPSRPYEMYLLVPHQFETVLKSFIAGAQEEAKKYNVKLTVQDAGGYNHPDVQVSQFENAIASKPDAIIVLAANSQGLNDQVDKAVAEGIKVVGAITGPESPSVDVSIDDDLTLQGEYMMAALANAMGNKGSVFMLVGGAGSPFNRDIKGGGKQALSKVPDVKVGFEKDLPAFNPADAQQSAESAVAGNPDVAGVFSSTIPEAQAATKAIKGAGKEVPAVATAIQTKEDLELLRSGEITAVGVTAATIGGTWAIDYAIKLLEGEEVPKNVELTPALITGENVDEAVDSGLIWNWVAESVLE